MVKSIYWRRMVKSIQKTKSVAWLEKVLGKSMLIVTFENEDAKKMSSNSLICIKPVKST